MLWRQAPSSGDGILLDVPLSPMLIDGCQILGNRITGVGGIGIEIRTPLGLGDDQAEHDPGRRRRRHHHDRRKGSAQHLSIANNQLLGLVPVVGQLQSALGIRLDLVAAAEMEGNVIRDLGMDVKSNVSRVGIALIACSSARLAGNQITNIGPFVPTFAPSAPSAGIAVTGPFDRAEVSNNVIRRSDPIAPSPGDFTLWRALYIGPLFNVAGDFTHSVVQTAPGQFVLVGDNVLAAVIQGAQLASVRGNVMAGGAAGPFSTDGSFVELDVTGSGIFTDNQCILLVAGNTKLPPLAMLTAPIVAASNNILTGGAPSLQMKASQYTALGNITSSPIPDLAAVWGPLNVHQ